MKKLVALMLAVVLMLSMAPYAFADEPSPDGVIESEATMLSLESAYLEIPAGTSKTLAVTVSPSGTDVGKLTWRSSNPKTVTVDENGKITAKTRGTATVQVWNPDRTLTARCKINVLFNDVTNKKLAVYNAVYVLSNKGVLNGYGSYFDVNGGCTRAQFVLFLWKYAGKPAPKSTKLTFTDSADIEKLAPDYKKAILWGNEQKIVMGYTSGKNKGKFMPNAQCTRGHVAMFLWRYKNYPEPKSKKQAFPDVNAKHTYFKAIQWASENKITNGYTSGANKGKFGVDDGCTRGQCVTFLYRLLGQLALTLDKTFDKIATPDPDPEPETVENTGNTFAVRVEDANTEEELNASVTVSGHGLSKPVVLSSGTEKAIDGWLYKGKSYTVKINEVSEDVAPYYDENTTSYTFTVGEDGAISGENILCETSIESENAPVKHILIIKMTPNGYTPETLPVLVADSEKSIQFTLRDAEGIELSAIVEVNGNGVNASEVQSALERYPEVNPGQPTLFLEFDGKGVYYRWHNPEAIDGKYYTNSEYTVRIKDFVDGFEPYYNDNNSEYHFTVSDTGVVQSDDATIEYDEAEGVYTLIIPMAQNGTMPEKDDNGKYILPDNISLGGHNFETIHHDAVIEDRIFIDDYRVKANWNYRVSHYQLSICKGCGVFRGDNDEGELSIHTYASTHDACHNTFQRFYFDLPATFYVCDHCCAVTFTEENMQLHQQIEESYKFPNGAGTHSGYHTTEGYVDKYTVKEAYDELGDCAYCNASYEGSQANFYKYGFFTRCQHD